jgi:hypothetical protein
MNQMNRIRIAAVVALALEGLSLNAQAVVFDPESEGGGGNGILTANTNSSRCTYEGHVIRVSAYQEGNNSFLYWRESALEDQYSYALLDDSQLLNAALQALNGPVQVRIRTDAACTSSRYKGFVSRIQLNP